MPAPPSRRTARILFLADTHLGLDLPARPRVARRRRGPEFFRNFELALGPAIDESVDLVIHGGDVFFRSRVRDDVVLRAVERLRRVAAAGTPVVIVPGNHERSRLPRPLLWQHDNLLVIDRPRTIAIERRGLRLAIAGFPYSRERLVDAFPHLVAATGWQRRPTDLRLLVMHQIVEGATVGPSDHVFRDGRDVIPGRQVPREFAAVLSGHIHRHQIRLRDLRGSPLAAPVVYPGSTERTSIAEKEERKGYLLLDVEATADGRGRLAHVTFRELPTRPMVALDLAVDGRRAAELAAELGRRLAALDPESIVRVRLRGDPQPAQLDELGDELGAEELRRLSPPTMNVDIAWPRPARTSTITGRT
jgi:DNA repair exonuclease SbcCD nuclease subunit